MSTVRNHFSEYSMEFSIKDQKVRVIDRTKKVIISELDPTTVTYEDLNQTVKGELLHDTQLFCLEIQDIFFSPDIEEEYDNHYTFGRDALGFSVEPSM